jgi:cyclase
LKRVRVIPVLLLEKKGLVKTRQFKRPCYIGDPINALKIFNDKMADELIVLDIEATARGKIDFDWVEDIVSEAFMPIAYGGGINSIDRCGELLRRGVEKVVINTAAYTHPHLIKEAAEKFGSQAVVVSIDVKPNLWRRNKAYIRGGRKETTLTPTELALRAEELGAGEIMLTSILQEGTFKGYDLDMLHSVSTAVSVPVIASGGAGKLEDFKEAVNKGGASAVAAGSLFSFQGPHRAVLITYPSVDELSTIWNGR